MNPCRAEPTVRLGSAAGLFLAALAVAMLGLRSEPAAAQGLAPSAEAEVGEPTLLVPPSLRGWETASPVPELGGLGRSSSDVAPRDIEVNPLAQPSLDGAGILSGTEGGFGLAMWQGTDRRVVERLLPRLPSALNAPSAHDLARRLLLSNALPPASEGLLDDSDAGELLIMRGERLRALGESSGLRELTQAIPASRVDQPLRRLQVDALLLEGAYDEACSLVATTLAGEPNDAAWQKRSLACLIQSGRDDEARLGLALLREAQGDEAFVSLAEAALGDLPGPASIATPGPAEFPLIDRLAEASLTLPPSELEVSLLSAVALRPAFDLESRVLAAEQGVAIGLLPADVLTSLWSAAEFSEAEGAAVTGGVASELAGWQRRALSYQLAAAAGSDAERAEAVSRALREVKGELLYLAAAQSYAPLIASIQLQPDLLWFAEAAGRALYSVGRFELASAWLDLSRQQAMIDPQAQVAVTSLWPFARLAGGGAYDWDGSLAAWSSARSGEATDLFPRRQTLLLSTLRAFGERNPGDWLEVAARSDEEGTPAPRAALLFALEEASEAGRLGETILLALLAFGDGGPLQSHPLTVENVLRALTRVGLEQEARQLAIEVVAANGI